MSSTEQQSVELIKQIGIVIGWIGFAGLVILQLIALMRAEFPRDFAVRYQGTLAFVVALLVFYGAMTENWMILALFAIEFVASFIIILVKVIRYRRYGPLRAYYAA